MRVAVVTGSNKGIGFAIVRQLCQQFDGIVYLTARNAELGLKAVADVKAQVPNMHCNELRFHQLEITDPQSVAALKAYLIKEHQGLDILVNNAAIAFKNADPAPFSQQATETIKVNYFGTKNVCDTLFPILKPHARVVNVSSQAGLLKQIKTPELKAQFEAHDLTVEHLDNLMKKFVEYAQEGKHTDHGYSNSAYGISKVGTTALTKIQQRMFNTDSRPDLVVNGCCPGYVDTDMTSHKGHLTPDQGAETPVYLSLLPPNVERPKGAFVYLKKECSWENAEVLNEK